MEVGIRYGACYNAPAERQLPYNGRLGFLGDANDTKYGRLACIFLGSIYMNKYGEIYRADLGSSRDYNNVQRRVLIQVMRCLF